MISEQVKAMAITQNPALAFARKFLTENGQDLRTDRLAVQAWCEAQAMAGRAEAQYCLGVLLLSGLTGKFDDRQAFEWLNRAVDGGSVAALEALADFVESGVEGVTAPDIQRSVDLRTKAAQMGYAPSLNSLAIMHLEGIHLEHDRVRAIQYLRCSAGLGDACGQCLLGVELIKEDDPEKVTEGVGWIKAAASQGHPSAHRHLGHLLMSGDCGLPRDPTEARKHLDTAASLEDESWRTLEPLAA